MIELTSVGREFGGDFRLRDVNLNVQPGEVFALIGPTGAGKTTLLRLMDLIDTPSSGRILFGGMDVTRSESRRLEARRRIAYVQQRPVAFNMSVYDNVACALKWRRESKQAVRRKVDEVLDLVGMSDYRDRAARTLSGGEMQRVALARALVTGPELLLLDEPTANLDPVSTSKIEEVLEHVFAEGKTTVVMCTHDMAQGQRFARRIGVLIKGALEQVGSPADVFCAPWNREVAEFVGVETILPGVVARQEEGLTVIGVNGASLQAVCDFAEGEKVHVMVRPEDVTFTLRKESSSARNVFRGRIRQLMPVGPLTRVQVDCVVPMEERLPLQEEPGCLSTANGSAGALARPPEQPPGMFGFPLLGVLTTRSAREMDLDMGTEVYASIKATAIHVIRRRQ